MLVRRGWLGSEMFRGIYRMFFSDIRGVDIKDIDFYEMFS